MEETQDKKRRARREEYVIGQAAKQTILPVIRNIPAWQTQAAYFHALLSSDRTSAERAGELRDQVRALMAQVEAQKFSLDAAVSELPPKIASSSRVEDAGRSLTNLLARLSSI